MSDYRKLLRILQKELSYQDKILRLLSVERAAIVKLDQERILDIGGQKEKLIGEAVALERERASVLEAMDISGDSKGGTQKKPFLEVIATCDEKAISEELQKTGEELKMSAESVKKLNEQNGDLIKQSLGIIASTISIMRSSPASDLPTYGRKGRLASEESDSAFASRSGRYTSSA